MGKGVAPGLVLPMNERPDDAAKPTWAEIGAPVVARSWGPTRCGSRTRYFGKVRVGARLRTD